MKTNNKYYLTIINMLKAIIVSLLFLVLPIAKSFSQQYIIKGRITVEETGKPASGIKISIKGDSISTTTNEKGEYVLHVPDSVKTIEFTDFSGMKVKHLDVKPDNKIDVLLTNDDLNIFSMSIEELLDLKVKVSSSKSETVFTTPSTVSVIDHKMVNQYGFRSVSDALSVIAGFNVYPTYHERSLPTSRGILQNQYANKILVLINGVPQWNAVTGSTNLNRVNIRAVERIEVLKGPASVIYGSNAYSGAINIVYKESENSKPIFYSGLGDGEAFTTGGNWSYKKKDFAMFFSGSITNEQSKDYSWTDLNGISGKFKPFDNINTFNLKVDYKCHSIQANTFLTKKGFFGAGPEWRYGTGQAHFEKGSLIQYSINKEISDKIRINAGGIYDYDKTDFSRSADDSIRNKWYGERYSLFVKSYFSFPKNINFEIGIDYDYRQSGDGISYRKHTGEVFNNFALDGNSTYEFSTFAQLDYKYKAFSGIIGTRLTKNEYFGQNLSSRGTFVWSLNDKNSLKLIAGKAFRAPSLFEMNVNSRGRFIGNKDLKPETCSSIELAYLTSFKSLFFQILGYYGSYKDKIQRIPKENFTTFENGSEFSAKGIEFELKYQNPKIIDAFFNFNYIDGNDGDGIGDLNFKYIPERSYSFGLSKFYRNFHASTVIKGWSETQGPFEKIEAQKSIDLEFGYSHYLSKTKVHHSLSVKNLTDHEIVFPEYVSKKGELNEIPMEYGYFRRVFYTLSISF